MESSAPAWSLAHPDFMWLVLCMLGAGVAWAIGWWFVAHAEEHKSQGELNRKFSERLGRLEGFTEAKWDEN